MRGLAWITAIVIGLHSAAQAQVVEEGSFRYTPQAPEIMALSGPITPDTVRDFRKSLRAQGADVLFLASPGGDVATALEVSAIIRDRGMSTIVPEGADCASACAFLLVAGERRRVFGRLGVHQFTSNGAASATEQSAQHVMAEIIDTLKEYDVSPQFLVRMLETPPDAVYWFPASELRSHGIETLSTFPDEIALYDQFPGLARMAPDTPPAPVTPKPAAETVPVTGPKATPRPSFDCAKAGTPTEFAICGNVAIATMDRRMADQYLALRSGASSVTRNALRDTQRAFLARRNQCGADIGCLETVYSGRLRELGI